MDMVNGDMTSSIAKLFIISELEIKGCCSSRLVQENCIARTGKAGNSLGFSCPCSNFWNAEPGRSTSTSQCQPCLHHYLTHSVLFPLRTPMWCTPFPKSHKGPLPSPHNPCQPWRLHTRSCDWPQWSWSLMQKGKYSLHLTYLRVKMKQAHTGQKPCCYQCDIVEAHDHNPILACDRDPAGSAGGQMGPWGWPLPGSQGCLHLLCGPSTPLLQHRYLGLWEGPRTPFPQSSPSCKVLGRGSQASLTPDNLSYNMKATSLPIHTLSRSIPLFCPWCHTHICVPALTPAWVCRDLTSLVQYFHTSCMDHYLQFIPPIPASTQHKAVSLREQGTLTAPLFGCRTRIRKPNKRPCPQQAHLWAHPALVRLDSQLDSSLQTHSLHPRHSQPAVQSPGAPSHVAGHVWSKPLAMETTGSFSMHRFRHNSIKLEAGSPRKKNQIFQS